MDQFLYNISEYLGSEESLKKVSTGWNRGITLEQRMSLEGLYIKYKTPNLIAILREAIVSNNVNDVRRLTLLPEHLTRDIPWDNVIDIIVL